MTWDSSFPEEAKNLFAKQNIGQNPTYSEGQTAGSEIQNIPEGRRVLFPNQLSMTLYQDGWVSNRYNPNDGVIASTLDEDVSGEGRTIITVAALKFDMSSGERIWIQTGDPSNPPLTRDNVIEAYLTGDAASGDTTLSIDDGSGNPVTITASQGDRVLSDTQSPWLIHAVAETKQQLNDFMDGFVDAGGTVDYVNIDQEAGIGISMRFAEDPRWDDSTLGLDGKSLKQVVADGPYTLQEIVDANSIGDPARVWNSENFIGRIDNEKTKEAIFDVIKQDFPNVEGSDYTRSGTTENNRYVDTDGNLRYDSHVFGTHGSHPLFASLRSASSQGELGNRVYRNAYGRHPFGVLRWQVDLIRSMHRGNSGKVMPWISYEALNDAFFNLSAVRQTPYYEEHIRHIALHTDAEAPVLYFNPHSGAATDEQDLNVDGVLSDMNQQVNASSYSVVTTSEVDWNSNILWTAIETANKRLWRVSVSRVHPDNTRDIAVSVSNGDTITIPGGEVGAWYETDKGADVTFSFTHPPIDNLLPSDNFIDFGSSVWQGDGNVSKVSDPVGGTDAYSVQGDFVASDDIPLSPGRYTCSLWVKRASGAPNIDVFTIDGNKKIGGISITQSKEPGYDDWVRTRFTFDVPESEGTGVYLEVGRIFADLRVYQPMINEGERAAPYVPPEAPSPGSQKISLQKGGNLVSTAIDPTYPDLETVLGDATSSIARVVTQDDQVFDPSEGTDEIGTWDPTEAYTIYAESPASFDVEGTVLGAEEVSLDAGWNWLPHLGSTSVPVDQAFDTIQNDLVMVKDEAGRVYRPAQNTDQIQSLEPGTAYKILLENPVTLSYPLE
ncbi:hypothetical protein GGQ08_001421 [Salinibacter ruber]|uniref:hypothetical protein n=1 Tax=Salinibacter ruber TaxID=146919 RepID=UPI001ABAC894|nr:hypothetical protein [Salinibacter ruber]MCS3650128.1 hypothetical protein [Salinibacter ruber]MCS3653381.1 hypothetical protein [Salinibacter ruber]